MPRDIKCNQLANKVICNNFTTKQCGIVLTLLNLVNWNTNTINSDCKKLAKEIGTNSKAISDVLNKLVTLSIIKRHQDMIMVNPNVFIANDNDKNTLNRTYKTFE